MNLDVPMLHIHDEFVPSPAIPCVCPSREISQETSPCAIHLSKGSEIPADTVRKSNEAVPMRDDNGPVESAWDVQTDLSVHGLRVEHEGAAIRGAVNFRGDASMRRLHVHDDPLVPF